MERDDIFLPFSLICLFLCSKQIHKTLSHYTNTLLNCLLCSPSFSQLAISSFKWKINVITSLRKRLTRTHSKDLFHFLSKSSENSEPLTSQWTLLSVLLFLMLKVRHFFFLSSHFPYLILLSLIFVNTQEWRHCYTLMSEMSHQR